jgi:hypothetical protein
MNAPATAADDHALIVADAAAADSSASPASAHVLGEITLRKSHIFDRVFLYGFDLQYSSATNDEYALIDQSMALGHIPVIFRLMGDRLQLLSDTTRLFESAVNHPEILVNEYRVIRDKGDLLTIAFERPGLLLHKTVNGLSASAPQDSWIRSLSYVAEGDYLLQESALLLADGRVQTYMESLFPRDSLVPDGYAPVEANRDTNDYASRFMLLPTESVYVERDTVNGVPVREQTAFATRFHLPSSDSTIDWYVTPNAPDEFLPELRSGVEGWNRYFRDQLGRDVMRFMGRLPEGVRLGDPRYNVINFDTVAEAGAAYESQAADPLTGIQSHSLIYMPYAWYNIASSLKIAAETPTLKSRPLGPRSPEALLGTRREVIRCARHMDEVSTPVDTSDDFGRRIFISTLFHEMGHALGMDHNFKGSLAYDGTAPVNFDSNPTTYSVMDYNYYQHEVGLMDAIGSSAGPRLEYDRQVISYLYNNGKDIAPSDPVIASCNDDDADAVDGGVDPNCLRYDAEKDPQLGLEHAFLRLMSADTSFGMEHLTLTQRVNLMADALVTRLENPALIPDGASAESFLRERARALGKTIDYYINNGAQSLRVNLKLNSGSLRAWRHDPSEDVLSMTEGSRRGRFADVLSASLALERLPDVPREALSTLLSRVEAAVLKGSQFGSEEERRALSEKLIKEFSGSANRASSNACASMRKSLADTLAISDQKAPFASVLIEGQRPERLAWDLLTRSLFFALTPDSLGSSAVQAARVAAASALATYASVGDDYTGEISNLTATLAATREAAGLSGRQDVVDHTRLLIKKLKP